MSDTYIKEFCSECNEEIENCTCQETEDSCPFCETIHGILELLDETDDYDDQFAMLHSIISDLQEQFYKEGYIDALRINANIMNEIADDMECEDCDCENCNGCDK